MWLSGPAARQPGMTPRSGDYSVVHALLLSAILNDAPIILRVVWRMKMREAIIQVSFYFETEIDNRNA
jgi:hypothetical protein